MAQLTEYQVATLKDAARLPGGVPVLTMCTVELVRAGLLALEKTAIGPYAKMTAKGTERLAEINLSGSN